ncbi:hypothetical protein F5146DRAFT_1002633 [Armillaria mellea]|nr:hypothetical protein F5146DRAFT_1002633 [Armillaria mellea]
MFADILFPIIFATAIHFTYRRWSPISISRIPGPVSKSFLYGKSSAPLNVDFKWQAMYGDVFYMRAPLGEDCLFISDPKTLQHIHHTASYRFPKVPTRRHLHEYWLVQDSRLSERQVLFATIISVNKSHTPWILRPRTKPFLPIFFACTEKRAQKWTTLIELRSDQSIVVNVTFYISRAALLDAIGEGVFAVTNLQLWVVWIPPA